MIKREIMYKEDGTTPWLMKTYSDYETETEIGMVKNQKGEIFGEAVDPIEYAEERQYTEIIVKKDIPPEEEK